MIEIRPPSGYRRRMSTFTALYNIEQRDDGWAVIDVRTGVAAVMDGDQLVGMPLEDADDLADLLSNREWKAATSH